MADYGKCAYCRMEKRLCAGPGGNNPPFCSTVLYPEVIEKSNRAYQDDPKLGEFARQASIQEGQCYVDREADPNYLFPVKPRLQEIIEFCHRMGYKKLGLAFCMGLIREAQIFASIMEKQGFEMVSVCCKVGAVPKEFLGLKNEEKLAVGPQHESMCNPVAQANILNEAGTDLNILLGLCVGHDSMFIKYAKAPVTVFAVKDRLLGHNPLAAIYTAHSYYERFPKGQLKKLKIDGES